MKILKYKKSIFKNMFSGFLWLSPSFVLMYLVIMGSIHFINAIILVTLFHFGAMFFLIKRLSFKK